MATKRKIEFPDLDMLERDITHDQRLAYSRMKRDEVHALSPEEKLRYFVSIQVQHPLLEVAQQKFKGYLSNIGGPKIEPPRESWRLVGLS